MSALITIICDAVPAQCETVASDLETACLAVMVLTH